MQKVRVIICFKICCTTLCNGWGLFTSFFSILERITQTVEITKHTVDIEEKGVKLKLTIVDTPGFGDAVNNTEWYRHV